MHRALTHWLMVLLPMGVAHPLLATPDGGAIGVSRGPAIQLTTRDSAILVWRTVGSTLPVVRYGTAPDNLDQEALPAQTTIRVSPSVAAPLEIPRLHFAPDDTYQYEAQVTGLTEDTVYYYGVFDGEDLLAGCSADHFFRTSPGSDAGRALRFWVVGDSGDGSVTQIAGFDAMKAFVANDGRPVDAFIHLGDMAYNDGLDAVFQTNFFDIYKTLLRNTVTWATMGNHEGAISDGVLGIGPYYDAYVFPKNGEAGGVPSGSEAYYSFDLGPIHFVCLNSHDEERSQVGRMATWLQQDLAQNSADWLIAFWHHPPYSKGSHHSDAEDQLIEMREVMVPILEDHGVDLILAGHSHLYERSMLLDGAYDTPTLSKGVILDDGDGDPAGDGAYRKSAHNHPHEGTVAVVAGHGRGAVASRFAYTPVHRKSILEAGSVLLDLEGDTVTVRMLNSEGVVRDVFQLIKRDTVAPRVPLVDPWSPLGPAIVSADRTPGETQVHLFARPLATDAILYYTLDGSEPTVASPIYTGPFDLTELTTVNAFSVWRGGQRTSPVATKIVRPPIQGPSPYLRIPILNSEDDASESNLGMVDLSGSTLGLDSANAIETIGLRFRDVPIPPNATIIVSGILFTPALVRTELATWSIHMDMSSSSNSFTSAIGNLATRPRSSRTVNWNIPSWGWVEFQNNIHLTPDLSGLIEEVIQRPGWQRGDSLGFLFSGIGDRLALAFDGNPDWTPELRLIFDERDALTLASDKHPLIETVETGVGTRELYLTLLLLESAPNRGLVYSIEGSPTLAPGSWELLNAGFAGSLFSPEPGFLKQRYQLFLPGGGKWPDEYFVRLRVTQQ
ncbi:MAG: metallophosphoesterase [Roseibacillus sp.]